MPNDNLSNDLRKIGKILAQKVKILHDQGTETDEYYQVPLLLDLINREKQIKTYDCEQYQISVKKTIFDVFEEQLPDKITAFTYKKKDDGFIEVLFDSKEHMALFLQQVSLEYSLNDHFIWKYDYKQNITATFNKLKRISAEPKRGSTFYSKSYGEAKKPSNCASNTTKDMDIEEFATSTTCRSERPYVLGPLQISKNDLLHSLKKTDRNIQIRQFYCSFGRPTEYFLLKFSEDKYIDALLAFLPHIQVETHTLQFVDAFLNVDVLNLNYLFPIRFRICDPVFISTVESRIVQLLNLFLPYEPDSQEIEETESELAEMCPGTSIYICFTDQNDNQLVYRTNGRVFIECDDISAAKVVFNRIGGLMFRDRPVIATYYPEMLFKARILSVFCI